MGNIPAKNGVVNCLKGGIKMKSVTDFFIESIRKEEREKLLNEGYIHKSDCPKAREDRKIRELKKANKSLQRKISELQLELETIKMMR